ncbi:ROK family transcriptional regulator [Umezawaea sp. Da 62-37]|uniref:ROK family transcriptional regulator n=1 Tax=Umezawaea sp. Da 62-37 TaxID=3075927 RepID=UPI0028F71A6F|nr:ROK family transcriptional regulator [Umezawaea sp. Da 62-37]WNV88166.1 ROK family transcriptional regulator [Umezawaea sp. Da 62-37]
MSGQARTTLHASSKAAVLDVIRAAGTISRVGLINATGFTGATISTVVRKLIDEGLVLETGRAESTGGKRRVLLQLNHASRYAIGVHLDHAGITYVLTNLGGAVVARITRPGAGTEEPALVVTRMAAEVGALVERVGVEPDRVLGVGLVTPGPLRAASGMALTPPSMRKWEDYPLDRALAKATGLPVLLDNDATAAALGEHWSGGVGGTSTSAALYMGTGIGAGLVIGGITYRGTSGNAGEIGHTCVDALGPECWCGARGCVESLAGPAAVVAAARADQSLARMVGLTGAKRARPSVAADFAAVSRAARRGEPQALAILERSARYIAVAAKNLANIMDLDVLVLTGPSFAVAGSVYLPIVRDELDRGFFARAAHRVDVRLSRSAATAPAIGGAAMVLQSELVPLHEGMRLPENLAAAEPAFLTPPSA